MSYPVNEKATASGAPRECFRFTTPSGILRYTSHHKPVPIGTEIFEPHFISRGAIEISSIIDSATSLDVTVSSTSELAMRYGYGETPQFLRVEIMRIHEGDADYEIEGQADLFLGASSKGDTTTLKFGSYLQSVVARVTQQPYFQMQCNHVLFDNLCKMVRSAWTELATVTEIKGRKITVNDDRVADNELTIGTMTIQRTGEARAIFTNVNNLIEVNEDFSDIKVGDTVELTLGCDHLRLGHCKLRYNNVLNYGGYDFIPLDTPFGES